MNLHAAIYQFLRGHNAEASIVCSQQSISIIPKSPIPVPTGWGFDGNLTSVSILPKDKDNIVIHGTLLGFKKDVVKTL